MGQRMTPGTVPRPRFRARRRRGMILLFVLIVFSAISLMALGLCHRARLRLRQSARHADSVAAYHLALGGIRRGLAEIGQDRDPIDYPAERWRLTTSAAAEGFLLDMLGEEAAEYQLFYVVRDEESRLNVNASSPATWPQVGLEEEVVAAIVDWMDPDQIPIPGGAETDYYGRLPAPYRCKDAPFGTLTELTRIRGVRWNAFSGEDANRNGILDPGEEDGAQSHPMDNGDDVLDLGLASHFTVYGDGKLNLNTAGPLILATLPGIDEDAVRRIDEYRNGDDGVVGTPDDRHFSSVEDLRGVGLADYQVALLEEYGTFSSRHFRLYAEARVHGTRGRCRVECIARRTRSGAEVVTLQRF